LAGRVVAGAYGYSLQKCIISHTDTAGWYLTSYADNGGSIDSGDITWIIPNAAITKFT